MYVCMYIAFLLLHPSTSLPRYLQPPQSSQLSFLVSVSRPDQSPANTMYVQDIDIHVVLLGITTTNYDSRQVRLHLCHA